MGWRVGGMEGWWDGGLVGWKVGGTEGWWDGGLVGWSVNADMKILGLAKNFEDIYPNF